ncbi:MAG: S9 family peptidase [Firmicutes bacterium]|nr:S9 family peptidase [Bacillota bacterium]
MRKEIAKNMRPVAIDDFCRFKFLSGLEFSPSGDSVSFVVSEADKKKNGYTSCIWTMRGGKPKKLTSFGKERSFQYLDDDTLLFPGEREQAQDGQAGGAGGKAPDPGSKYYRISLSGGEAELAYTFPIPVSKVLPLKDGSGDLLIAGTVMPGFEDLYKGDEKYKAEFLRQAKDNADYEVIEQSPWWWNGGTYTKGAYSGLFRWDAKKKALEWLTPKNVNVSDPKLSKDGKYVYYMASPVRPRLVLAGENSLCRMSVAGGRAKTLAKDEERFFIFGFELADDFIIIVAHDNRYGLNSDPDFFKMDYKTGAIELYAAHGESIGSSICTDIHYGENRSAAVEGNTLYFVSTRFDQANLYKLEDGVISEVIGKAGSVDGFAVRNGKILAVALWDMKGQEIYDAGGRRLTGFNSRAMSGRYVAEPEFISVRRPAVKGAAEGASEALPYEVHGFVLKPFGYDPAKKYPVILDVHGGPKCAYGAVYFHEMQYWTGKGYFVIYCNPTGSDGRNIFSDIRGKYGTVDFDDIMAFTDACLKKYPSMDKNDLFETGGSYGGFMTNWIIGHTDRFRACASQRSISNWLSFYGVSDIGVDFSADQNAAGPWSDPAALWEHSPLKYADRVKTPTLFLHSFEDYRCPVDQGYQMFTALLAHGVESRLICFRGENHELSRSGMPLHRIRRLKEITDWFDSHRKNGGK